MAKKIAKAAAVPSGRELLLITALTPRPVQAGVLDPKALRVLRNAGFAIRSVPNLHAKLSIAGRWGMVGSGNLTNSGSGDPAVSNANVELGVVLSRPQLVEAAKVFERWWDLGAPVTDKELRRFEDMPPFKFPNAKVKGVGDPIDGGGRAGLRKLLEEDLASASSRSYWLKSNYHRRDNQTWWTRGYISDHRKAPYAVGDQIVLYLGKKNDGPMKCPAVVEVVEPSGEDRKFLEEQGDHAAADQWPFVTRTVVLGGVLPFEGVDLESIGKSGYSLRGGYCHIERPEFETLVKALAEPPSGF